MSTSPQTDLSFLIQNYQAFSEAISFLKQCNTVACDTETYRKDAYDDKLLMGVGFYAGGKSFYMPFRHEHDSTLFGDINLPIEWLPELNVLFSDETKTWIFFNAAFDTKVLEREGLSVLGQLDDAQIKIHLADENHFKYSLDSLGHYYLSEKKDPIEKKVLPHYPSWEAIPPVAMGKYCVQDCELTSRLDTIATGLLQKEELTQLYREESEPYIRVLSKVIHEGILIDRERAAQLERDAHVRLREIEQLVGFAPSKKAEVARILHAVPEAGGLGLYPLNGLSKVKTKVFPDGLPNTDVVALSMLRLEDVPDQAKQVIDLTLEYRALQKAASTYYSALQRKASLRTNKVHADLKQHGTKTGRLSGDMQQIPRDQEKYPVKSIFTSEPGWELWEFDMSQIELRLAVVYAECEALGRAYIDGADIHHQTATLIGAYEHLNDAGKARQIGKTSNFLLGYLGGPDKLQYTIFKDTGIVTSLEQNIAWHRGFNDSYPEFRRKAYEVIKIAENRGYIKLWNGRKRRFPRRDLCFKAWNSLIQGGAGMIMQHTMIRLDKEPEFLGRMCNQVHDSLWIYLPTEHVESQRKLITEVMEWPTQDLGFPFPVESKRLDVDRAA